MANGLRKLIKRSRRELKNQAGSARRRFGPRLRVEELEERIAPVAGLTGTGVVSTNTVALNNSGETAIMENAAGDIWTFTLTETNLTGGDVLLTFDSAGTPTKVSVMDFGNTAALAGTGDALITLVLTNDAGSAAMSVDSVIDTNTNVLTTSFKGTDNTTADLITVGSVALGTSTVETWNTGAITTFSAIGVDTSMRVGAVTTSIATTADFLGTLTVTGSLAGPVVSALTIGAITLEAGSTAAGTITATTGNIGAITLGNAGDDDTLTFAGAITASDGSIASISGTDETSITLSGAVTANTSIGAITTQIQDISSTITSTTSSVGAVTVLNDFTGTIVANTTVGAITVANDLTGDITAGTTIGAIVVTNGSISSASAITAGTDLGDITVDADESGDNETMSGTVIATAGSIGDVTVGGGTGAEGDLVGSLTAGTTIGDITVGNDITSTASVVAGTDIGDILADDDIAGDITATAGAIGDITVTNGGQAATSVITAGTTIGNIELDKDESGTDAALAGTITAAGSIGTIDVGGDVGAEGDISGTVTSGTTIGAISIGNDLMVAGSVTAGTTLAAVTIDGDLAGTLASTANATGAIAADDMPGTINVGGDLTAGVVAGSGNIAALNVTGAIDTTGGGITISGTDVTVTAGGLLTGGGNALAITATDDATVTVNGQSDGQINAANGTITITADDGDVDDTDDAGDGGDLTVSSTDIWIATSNITLNGDAVSVTMNTNANAAVSDNSSLTAINADGTVTIASVTGSLTATTIDSDDSNIGAITTTGALTVTTLTAPNGTVGAITAGDDLSITTMTATVLGAVTADNTADNATIAAGTWTASTGDVGAVTAEGAITITTSITATAGKVGVVTSGGAIAGGGNIVSGAATTASPLMTVIEGTIKYTVESDAGAADASFNIDFETGGANNAATIIVTNTAGNAIDLSLKTNNTDDTVNDQHFDLTALSFDAATVTAGKNKFDVVTVEGSTAGAISLGVASAVNGFVVQDNLGGMLTVDSLNLLSAARIGGVAATAALADDNTDSTGVDDPTATAVNGSFVIPIDPTNDSQVFGADGDPAFFTFTDFVTVGLGSAVDSEATVTFTSGAFTSVSGSAGGFTLTGDITVDQDLSNITGDISITGDIASGITLTIGDVDELTITGTIDGTLTAGDIDGDLALGDVDGTATIGDVTDDITIDSVGDSGMVTIGDFGADIDIAGDMDGSLIVGDGDDIDVAGAVGSFIQVGDVDSVTAVGDLGSVGSVIAGDMINTLSSTNGDVNANIFLLGLAAAEEVSIEATNGLVTGTLVLGIDEGVSQVDIDSGGDEDRIELGGDGFVSVAAGNFDGTNTDAFDTVILKADGDVVVTDEDGVLGGANLGNLFSGDDFTANIDVEGDITGTITVDDDANVSALLDIDAVFGTLITGLSGVDLTNAQAFQTSLAGNTSTIEDNFDDQIDFFEDFADLGNGGAVDITAESLGGIVVEGKIDSTGDFVIFDGDMGNMTVGGTIDIGSLTVDEGDLGLITAGTNADAANEGDINIDITVDDGDFAGMMSQFGGYDGILLVNGNITDILLGEAFNPTAPGTISFFNTPTGFNSSGGHFAIDGTSYNGTDVTMSVTGAGALLFYDTVTDRWTVSGTATTATVVEVGANDLDDVVFESALSGTVTVTDATGLDLFRIDTGDLSGTATVSGPVDDLFINEGNLSGSFTSTGDMDTLSIDGNWTGTVTLNPVADDLINGVVVAGDDGEVSRIRVSGSVSTAVLVGDFDPTDATDLNGDPLASSTVIFEGNDDPVKVGGSNQYVFVGGGKNVDVRMDVLFSQVTGFELTGRGRARIVSIESATAPTAKEMKAAGKTGLQVLRGKAVTSDLIDVDEPGEADLPDITIAPRISVTSLVVDGDVGDIIDPQGNLKNLYVSGDAEDIRLGGSLINGYFGGDVDDIEVAKSIKNIQIAGDVDTLSSNKISKVLVEGDVDTFSTGKATKVDIFGDVDDFSAGTTRNVNVFGRTENLSVTGRAINSIWAGEVENAFIFRLVGNSAINLEEDGLDDDLDFNINIIG